MTPSFPNKNVMVIMVFAAEFWCPTKALLMRQQPPPISKDKAVDFFLPIFSMVKYDSEYPKKII